LFAVIDETRALFHRLKVAAEQLHRGAGISAGQRAVLMDLASSGAQTVPQMARSRPVSRQHIQSLVNPLLAAGLVALAENPAHKRSRIVQLTEEGRAAVSEMRRGERQLLEGLPHGIPTEDLEVAARALRGLRDYFSASGWERRVRAAVVDRSETTSTRGEEA
jgi:DNA-binding MarR family transcriptional regulator